MKATLSVTIMAHPRRTHFIPELMDSLDDPSRVEVVWDQINSRWDTGRRAMLQYDPAATHHLVLQDDAIVCRDLFAGIERALPFVPAGHPVGLYLGKVRPHSAVVSYSLRQASAEVSWITMRRINWGVGIVVPTVLIPEIIQYCDSRNIENYDLRLSKWFEMMDRHCYYPWPSLVDHRDSPSLVAGRNGGRHAHNFLGEKESALGLKWDGIVMNIRLPGP